MTEFIFQYLVEYKEKDFDKKEVPNLIASTKKKLILEIKIFCMSLHIDIFLSDNLKNKRLLNLI